MPSGAEDLAAAKAALAIVQMANKQGWLDKLKDIFKTKHKILVLGSTGVGKSNFIDSLQTLVPKAIDHLNRTEWATSQRVRLAGVIFDLIDTPGQDAHRPRRFEAATEALRESSFGMINVVAWGYHEYRTGQAEALMPNGQPNPSWLEKHRAIELNSAAEWAPLMTARPSYVITLVTKADLWWAQRDEVIRYYEGGPYYDTIRDAVVRGHVVLPYSSVYHRFYDVAPMSGVFEAKDRVECQQRLLQELFMATARNR